MQSLDDIENAIRSHPLPAIGAALALGAIVALARPRSGDGERSVGGMIIAGLGAVAVRLVKSYALTQLSDAAKSWLLDPQVAASREPATGSFLRH